jgi:hypothetical protein
VTLLDRRRVWIWLAYWAQTEADAEAYAYPRPDGWEERHVAAWDASERFYDKLEELGGPPDDEEWREAIDAFGRPNA